MTENQSQGVQDPDLPGEGDRYELGFVTLLETVWGDGHLSPGGDESVIRIVEGLDLAGKTVLDIGSGLGASVFVLAEQLGAGRVVGIDVQAGLIEKSTAEAARRGLEDRVRFECVEPGGLPFDDGEFDVVYSKDAIAAIPGKEHLAREIFRLLKPGGIFAASDWMSGTDGPMPTPLRRFADVMTDRGIGLASPDRYFAALRAAGFEDVSYRDRTAWHRDVAEKELASLRGPLYDGLVEKVGRDLVDHMIGVWTVEHAALETADLGLGQFRAVRL